MPSHEEMNRMHFVRRLYEAQFAIPLDNRCETASQSKHEFNVRGPHFTYSEVCVTKSKES